MAEVAVDPSVLRAGSAFADRRVELGLTQRDIAGMKIMGQPALVAFEKGRAWPREKTRAKLEQVARWPPGTLAKLRDGVAANASTDSAAAHAGSESATLVTDAVLLAMGNVVAAIDALPSDDDPAFAPRAHAVLADLRKLEAITARAVRSSQGAPEVIKALRLVRTRYDDLMARSAASPGATLGQRLYVARNRAALSVAETAGIADLAPEVISAAESEHGVSRADAQKIEALIDSLNRA
ncbi:helix-turn-helix transcriptional regulator [Mycobacterium sp. OAE908]|uniref:helix-turn-helix domain-containing protein n=1 Tax=Mycobacterium sp. OAE908 TaxID=2817899 RepID=UPI001AE1EC07